MKRTTVMLPSELHEKATRYAAKRKVSLGHLIRTSLRESLDHPAPDGRRDPLWDDETVVTRRAPRDLARNHDRYLEEEND
jgi:hypothetical protein